MYSLLVFAHVLGAVATFAALGIESVALRNVRRANDRASADLWIDLLQRSGLGAAIAMAATVGAGIALMILGWGRQPWIAAAFVGVVAMAILNTAVTRRTLRRLRASLQTDAAAVPSLDARNLREISNLRASLVLRIAIGVGILGLMTAKPDAFGSSLILGGAVLAGLLATRRVAPARIPASEAQAA
jgi:hypothetical protein